MTNHWIHLLLCNQFLHKPINYLFKQIIQDTYRLATQHPYVRHVASMLIFIWLTTHFSPAYAFDWNPQNWFQKKDLTQEEIVAQATEKIDTFLVIPHTHNLERRNEVFDAGQQTKYILDQLVSLQNSDNVLNILGILNSRETIQINDFDTNPSLKPIKIHIYEEIVSSKNLVVSRQEDFFYHIFEAGWGALSPIFEIIIGILYLIPPFTFFFGFDWDTYLKVWFCFLTLGVIIIVEYVFSWIVCSLLGKLLLSISSSIGSAGAIGFAFATLGGILAISAPLIAVGASFLISKAYPFAVLTGDFDKYSTPNKEVMCISEYASNVECVARNIVEFAIFFPGILPYLQLSFKVMETSFISIENSFKIKQIKPKSIPVSSLLKS